MPSDPHITKHFRLGRIPVDWRVLPFREVVEFRCEPVKVVEDESYQEIGIRSHGKGIFHKEPVSGNEIGKKRVFWVQPDCLVFNIVFAWEGAVAVTSSNEAGMIASHRFPMYSPSKPSIADVEFLRRFFQTELGVRLLGDASPGGAGRNRTLNQKFLASTPLPLPPFPEQRKIAAILSSVDETIEKIEAVIEQLQVVKKAMMQELLTRGLPGRHTRFKKTEIGEIPEKWEVVPLSEISDVQTGIAKGKKVGNGAVEVPYLRVANVQDGYVDLAEMKVLRVEATAIDRYRLRSGDVLFTEGGDADKLGRGCVWRGQIDPCLHQNHVFAVRTYPDRLVPEFLSYFGGSPQGKAYFLDAAKQTTNLASINSTQLKALPVPVPSLEEQRQVAEVVYAVESRIEAERKTKASLAKLKTALMSVLLTGEVRVTPNEEAK